MRLTRFTAQGAGMSNKAVGRQVSITNMAKRALVVSLNSKASIHLAPGATSPELAEYEVLNNPDIRKLRERALIEIVVRAAVAEPESARPAARDK